LKVSPLTFVLATLFPFSENVVDVPADAVVPQTVLPPAPVRPPVAALVEPPVPRFPPVDVVAMPPTPAPPLVFAVDPPVALPLDPPTGVELLPLEFCAPVPPVLALPPVVFVPVGLEFPPVALIPPEGSPAPAVLEPARAVMPPESIAPPLACGPAVAPPTLVSPALPELEPLQATTKPQMSGHNPVRVVFIKGSFETLASVEWTFAAERWRRALGRGRARSGCSRRHSPRIAKGRMEALRSGTPRFACQGRETPQANMTHCRSPRPIVINEPI